MSRKSVLVLLFVIILVSLQYPRFQQNEVEASDGYPVHNLSTGLNYTSIQEAIDASETLDEHTIFVDAGIYLENLVINKTLSLIGESKENTIVDGKNESHVVNVTADRVVLKGFTLNNSAPTHSGIYLNSTNFVNITDNIIEHSTYPMTLDGSSYNTVSLNQIVDNECGVIVGRLSENNNIVQNEFARDDAEAITVHSQSHRNYIYNNTILDCRAAAHIDRSDDNVFSNNMIWNCTVSYMYVIDEMNSRGNLFEGNVIDSYIRHYEGMSLYNCNQSTIVGNTIMNCQYGIYVADCMDNTFYHNNLINCSAYVFFFRGPSLGNVWDNGSEGNYWSDYNGTDSNQDGIGDTPYIIDESNTDRYPLMVQFVIPEFPSFLILPLFMIAASLAITVCKRRHLTRA